jgi:hypothetical protein
MEVSRRIAGGAALLRVSRHKLMLRALLQMPKLIRDNVKRHGFLSPTS